MSAERDIYTKLHDMMVLLHRSLKKALESIITQIEEDQKQIKAGKESKLQKDLPNWLNYIDAFIHTLEHHHKTEDLFMFPPFKAAGIDMEGEKEAHEKIHAILDRIEALVKDCQGNSIKYNNGEEILQNLKEVQEPLIDHLNAEVSKLTTENLSVIPVDKFKEIWRKGDEYGKAGPTFTLPFFFHHLPSKETKEVLEILTLPAFVSWIILPAFNFKHSGLWKYAPYQMY
jgi:Hemerythrin HHE cation binding domain